MGKKTILIVAPDTYAELVSPLVDYLRTKTVFDAEARTLAEYSANETPPSDEVALMFIGHPTENPYTAFYYPKMAFRLNEEAGAYYGESKNRILIFGDGDVSHRRQLKAVMREQKTGERCKNMPERDTAPSFWGYATVYYAALYSFLAPVLAMGGMFLFNKVMGKKIRFLQVILGIDRFLEEMNSFLSQTTHQQLKKV